MSNLCYDRRMLAKTVSHPVVYDRPLWRMTVERYHRMIAAGTLTEDDKIELLDGLLVTKIPINPPHAFTTNELYATLSRLLGDGYHVRSQQPITLSTSEPEPDATIVRGRSRDYARRHPQAHEVAIVIEVSDATLREDQTTKKRIYAQAGINEYWVVNLKNEQIEQFSQPVDGVYQRERVVTAEGDLSVMLAGETVGSFTVAAVLP